jgi:pimeloyl-ACP methyl ester carboxylesterase
VMLVDIGGYRLALYAMGQGVPPVVLDAGQGHSAQTWTHVQAAVANFTHVCAYDRAGLGQSDKSPFPRTSPQIVAELRTLLHYAQYAGPFILVGHSFGGLNMQCFALHHPREVAGLLLIDPPFPDFITGLHQLLTPDQWTHYLSLGAADPEGVTLTDAEMSLQHVRGKRLPNVPMVVLSSDTGIFPQDWGWPNGAIAEMVQHHHAVLADQSAQGRHIVVPHSSHFIQRDYPDMMVALIRDLVSVVRGSLHGLVEQDRSGRDS